MARAPVRIVAVAAARRMRAVAAGGQDLHHFEQPEVAGERSHDRQFVSAGAGGALAVVDPIVDDDEVPLPSLASVSEV